MRIGSVIIDTDNMTAEEVNVLIQELKGIRARKSSASTYKHNLISMVFNMKNEGFTFCNKDTAEVLNPDDWLVYDDTHECVHEGRWNV